MKWWITILLFFLAGAKVYSQSYQVSYSTLVISNNDVSGIEDVHYRITSNNESQTLNGVGTIIITGRPLTIDVYSYYLDVDEFGNLITECDVDIQIIYLPNTECFTYSNPNFNTTCMGNVFIQLEVTPVVLYEANTSPENDINNSIPYCITDPIRIVATPGFSSYNWQYKIAGQNWLGFNPGLGNDVSFTLQDVIGVQADTYLNKFALFRYIVGNCSETNASAERSYTFTIPPPVVTGVTASSPTCFNGSDGSVSVASLDRSLITGEGIIYDLFDNVSPTPINQNSNGTFINLSPGQYAISIQANSFSYCTTSGSAYNFQINNPSQVDFTTAVIQEVICFETNSATIKINAFGGSGPIYSYSIDGGQFNSSSTISNLAAGNHNVTVNDSNGCSYSKGISLNGPTSAISAYIDILSDYNGSSLSCTSASDAVIDIVASNGWGNFSYSNSLNGTYLATTSFNNLPAGTHSFWIRDGEGCTISRDVIISPPNNIVVNDVNLTLPQCLGDLGSIMVTASGGTGTFQYSIDNINFQLSSHFFVPAGSYNIYVKDANSCTSTTTGIIVQDPAPIGYNSTIGQISCQGGVDGTISIENVTNGVPPYQYSVNGGATFSANATFDNIQAGVYDLVVRDNNGCITTSSITVSEPDQVSGLFIETPILCNGDNNGVLLVVGAGGNGTFNYLWSNGQTSDLISNLSTGSYNVIITDQNGCESNLLSYSMVEPNDIFLTPLNVMINGYEISCFGGSDGNIDLAVSGGTITSDYTYQWSNGQTTNSLTNVVAGQYSVVVTDDNDCFTAIIVDVTQPQALEFSELIVGDVSCFQGNDGTLQVNVVGGVGDYVYSLNGGTYEPINFFTNLSAGNNIIRVKDLNACEQVSTINITSPDELVVVLQETKNTFCGQANGLIDITVSGGVAPFQYNWQNELGESVSNSEDLVNFFGGAYSLLITDANGCTSIFNSTISNTDGPSIQVALITGTTCFDSADGTAQISVSGGLPPYNISWDNGEIGQMALSLISGMVEVSVIDDAGCITFLVLDIPGKEEISIFDVQTSQPTCFGGEDGSISISVIGGTMPYSYNWANGTSGSSLSNIASGNYDLTIVDSNNCIISESVILNQPEPVSINYEVYAPSCINNSDGMVSLLLSGGIAPYDIFLDNNLQSSAAIQNLAPGSYLFLVNDANGCSESLMISVPDADPWIIFLEDLIICEGQEVEVNAPVEATSFEWLYQSESIGTGNSITISGPGQYNLEVINSSGCNGNGSFFVTTSNEVLSGDFLMSSKAYVGDTIVIIDITFPLPDSIKWDIPSTVEIVESTEDLAIVIFNESGIYDIGFDAYLGNCRDYYSSSIEILSASESPINGRLAGDPGPVIISLEVYPNPNDGNFTVESTFRENQGAKMKLIYLQTNQLILEETRPSMMEHSFQLDIPNLAPGTYALVIETSNEVKVVRMIKR